MQKNKILNAISRYYIATTDGSVKWTVKDGEATIHFLTDDKTCRLVVTQRGVALDDGVFGIYDTAKFKQVFAALDNEVSLEYHKNHGVQNALYIKDDTVTVDFLLSDLGVIFSDQNPDPETARPFKEVPNPTVELVLTQDLLNRFIKAKSALPESAIFAVRATEMLGKGECEFIINYSTHPTNQIKIPIQAEVHSDLELIAFNVDVFKDILLANKDFVNAQIRVYHIYDENLSRYKGMIECVFSGEDWTASYRLNKVELV